MTTAEILANLDRVRETGRDSWIASCPVPGHGRGNGDRNPSLSVRTGPEGQTLLRCHGGCEVDSVVSAIGLDLADLFDRNGDRPRRRRPAPQPAPLPGETELADAVVALRASQPSLDRLRDLRRWTPDALTGLGIGAIGGRLRIPTRDQGGRLVNVLAYTPSPGDGERKTLALGGRPRNLFPPPESIEDRDLLLVEGEADVISAATLGLPAVAIPGANGWKPDYAVRFKGRRVTIVPDADAEGRKLATRVAADLAGLGIPHRILDLNPDRDDGHDLGDHLLAAESVEAARDSLLAMAETISFVGDADPKVSESREPAGVRLTSFATLSPEQIEWLWPERVPMGMLTLLVGDPGLGKSLLTVHLAAKVSRAGGDVVLSSAEDHATATVLPRLQAADAAMELIHRVDYVESEGLARTIELPDDVDALAAKVAETEARLLVVDPLSAHLPENVNSWRDQSIRRALAPLHRLAETSGCAVVVVAHLNKSTGADPLYRTGGSIGIPAAVRSALLLARDPEDPDGDRGTRRVLAHHKSNVGALAESLSYEIEVVGETVKLRSRGTSPIGARDLLDSPTGEERTERDEAMDFLRAELKKGPRLAKQIQAAAREAGISPRTLERAKSGLGVTAKTEGVGEPWKWTLPPDRQPPDRHPDISDVAASDETALESQKTDPESPDPEKDVAASGETALASGKQPSDSPENATSGIYGGLGDDEADPEAGNADAEAARIAKKWGQL